MGFIITNGYTYIGFNQIGGISYTFKEKAHIFEEFESAHNFIAIHRSALDDRYHIVDCGAKKTAKTSEGVSERKRFSDIERKVVYAKTKGRCALCGKFMDYDSFTVDHIVPLAKGGTNNMDNLQAACYVCNRIKQDILPQDFMDKVTEIFLHDMKVNYRPDISVKLERLGKVHKRKFLLNLIKKL